jgi:hypothetical protein
MSELVDIRTALVDLLANVQEATSITNDDLGAIEGYCNNLSQMADGHEEVELMIQEIKNRAYSLVEQNASLTFQVAAIGSVASNALQQAEAEQSVRNELEDAIDSGDEEHPRLRDFASDIRDDDAMDLAVDWEEALKSNYDQFRHDLIKRIQSLTYYRCDVYVATQFVDVLLQRVGTPSDLQREMLSELVGSFAREAVHHGL